MACLLLLTGWWGRGWEDTENAYVEGHLVLLSSQVEAVVAEVLVEDHQAVEPGDLLLRLDSRAFEIALAEAEAQLDATRARAQAAEAALERLDGGKAARRDAALSAVRQATAELASARAERERAEAPVLREMARARLAARRFERVESLVDQGVLPLLDLEAAEAQDEAGRAELLAAQAEERASEEHVEAARQALRTAEARLELTHTLEAEVREQRAVLSAAQAEAETAQAAVARARLDLERTELRAPRAGRITRRNAEVGQWVRPGTALLGLVATDEMWVVAYFQQEQVARMAPGQGARVEVEGPGWGMRQGVVQGVAMATGSKFSVLPPDHATGYFIKVPQWIPVRIDLLDEPGGLRPGMAARVSVETLP